MKATKKRLAIFLTFILGINMPGIWMPWILPEVHADTQAPPDTITVCLKVEDVDSTLVSQDVTITKDEIARINNTFTVESGDVEIPVLTSNYFTAAHAVGKYINGISDSPKNDLTFSYGSPAYIKGQKDCDFYSYWSFRVNNTSPADESTGYSYTPDTCPIKNGDTVVFFRQACYDETAGDYGAYTSYSWFGKDRYETTVNSPLSVTYQKDDGFGSSANPAADETLGVYEGSTLIREVKTGSDGSALLSFDRAGTYLLTGGRLQNGIPALSHASAVITVTAAQAPTATPPAASTAAPQTTPSVKPDAGSVTPTVKKPAAPKKLKASVKKNKVTLTWKKSAGANGYQLFISKKKANGFKKWISTKKTTAAKKIKSGKYYIKVRSYAKKGGKTVYSKYSKTIRVSVK